MPIVYLLVFIPFGLAGLGYFFDKFGEGVDSASTGATKLILAAVVGVITLKYFKVIK